MKQYLYIFLCSFLLIQCKSENAISKKSKVPVEMKAKEPKLPAADLDYIMGKFDPAKHEDFVVIPRKYADREGLYLRRRALNSFVKMHGAAAERGITMEIKSATRNFDYQKRIWDRKYTGTTILSDGTNVAADIKETKDKCLKILEYSSMPSTSRHHWGTEIDINSFSNSYFESGEGKKLYTWMLTHAADYGWCQPYTPHGPDRPHGYFEEKWHWSYMPISQMLTRQSEAEFKDEMIKGFLGSEAAIEIGVVEKYVLGIDKRCM